MSNEISVISNIIFEYKENLKDSHYKTIMEQLKTINEKLPKYSCTKSDEISMINNKIYKLENEIRILKGLKEEMLRERGYLNI